MIERGGGKPEKLVGNGESSGGFSGARWTVEEHVRTLKNRKTPINSDE